MAIIDISRLRRPFASAQELATELATIFDTLNRKGFQGPLLIATEGDEPAFKIHMPEADLEVVPPVQIRSKGQAWSIPAWYTGYDPIPNTPVSGFPTFTDTPHPPPFGQTYPDVSRTSGATQADPFEEEWWQPPMTVAATVVSGSTPTFTMDVFLADPATGTPFMRLPVTDRTGAMILGVGDVTSVILYFPLALEGGCEAFIV